MVPAKYFFWFFISLVFIFQSCSLEKRHYTNGYHLQWKKNVHQTISQNTKITADEVKNKSRVAKDSTALTENIIGSSVSFHSLAASSEKKKGIVLLTVDSTVCDTIIMRDGTEIKAKVVEVTLTEIKYKYCNNINGPTYVAYRYNVAYIKYPNGTMDSFVNEYPPSQALNRNRAPGGNYGINEFVRKRSLASLILGIVSFFISFFGIITAIVAIVLGYKCLRLIKQDPENLWMYQKRAHAGVILGWIALIGKIVLWALIFTLIGLM